MTQTELEYQIKTRLEGLNALFLNRKECYVTYEHFLREFEIYSTNRPEGCALDEDLIDYVIQRLRIRLRPISLRLWARDAQQGSPRYLSSSIYNETQSSEREY